MFNLLQKSKIKFAIVGLGNPGKKYENTRHNAGFMVIDKILREKEILKKKVKHEAQIFETIIAENRVLLVKPQTYMNLSGDSVTEITRFYKIPIENVVVIADEISLPPGKLRIRRKGSDGGHNGLKDIILKTGFDTFARIKIGVGNKPNNWNLADWVLSEFTNHENEKIDLAAKNACQAIELIVCGKVDEAMNKFNS